MGPDISGALGVNGKLAAKIIVVTIGGFAIASYSVWLAVAFVIVFAIMILRSSKIDFSRWMDGIMDQIKADSALGF